MSAGEISVVFVWIYRYGAVQKNSVLVEISPDARVYGIGREVAHTLNVSVTEVNLWKPHQFLSRKAGAADELRERLEKHDQNFSKFCDDLTETEMDEKPVSQLFSLSSSRPRQAKNTALIATITPSRQGISATYREVLGAEEQSNVAELRKNYKATVAKKNSLSPSVNARPYNYCKHQDGPSPILDGRYCEDPRAISAPVEIFHPVFAEFVANINDETLAIPKDVVEATIGLMTAASKIVTNEGEREDTRLFLERLLRCSITQSVNRNRTSADHIITHSRQLPPFGHAALAIVEEKGELGMSCEGSVQGSFSYLEHWTDRAHLDLNELSFCPSFVISIAGPWIVICGAILTSHVIVQRLTDYLWLGHSRLLDDGRTLKLARIFQSLRLAIQHLDSYYKDLLPTPNDPNHRFYPLANSYTADDGKIIKFRYLDILKGADPACVTFLATQEGDENESKRIVVKFAERYGADVHRFLANRGLSPKLLYCGDIWPEMPAKRGCGSRNMVVMEYINWETAADRYSDSKVPQVVCDAVQGALRVLHDSKMVHGDIRLPNILVQEDKDREGEGVRTQIIDFDWAGTEGEARYPLRLSQDIEWASGVGDHELIKAEHDEWMVEKWR